MLEIIQLERIPYPDDQGVLTGTFGFLWRLNLLLNNSHEELELVVIGVLEKSVERGGSL